MKIVRTCILLVAIFGPGRRFTAADELAISELTPYKQVDVNIIAFSHSGRLCATSGPYGINVWEVASRSLVSHIEGHDVVDSFGNWASPTGLAFSADEQLLFSAGTNGNIYFWRVTDGKRQEAISYHMVYSEWGTTPTRWDKVQRVPIASLAISPDGGSIAASMGHTVFAWSATTREQLQYFGTEPRTEDLPFGPLLVPATDFVVPESRAEYLKSWYRMDERDLHEMFLEHWLHLDRRQARLTSRKGSIAFAKDGFIHGGPVAYSPDGRLLFESVNGCVVAWDIASRTVRFTFPYASFAVSPDSKRLALHTYREPVSIWNLQTGAKERTLKVLASAAVFSPDGEFLITVSEAQLYGWAIKSGERVWQFPDSRQGGAVRAIAVCPKSGQMAVTWDSWDAKLVRMFQFDTKGSK